MLPVLFERLGDEGSQVFPLTTAIAKEKQVKLLGHISWQREPDARVIVPTFAIFRLHSFSLS